MATRRLSTRRTDAEWERFGRRDPYYGVCAFDEFRGRALDADVQRRFFASGEEHVAGVFELIQATVDSSFSPRAVLDYGCGVGRLLVPFASRADRVVGVDVSAAMLDEARRNCDLLDPSGVELGHTDRFANLRPEFSLVHSALVLQHVPVREGERIISALVRLLAPGGIGILQMPTGARRDLAIFNRVMKLPLAHNVLNVLRGRPWSYPHMQMNSYDLGRVVRLLRAGGIEVVHVRPDPPHSAFDGCTVVFRVPGG